MTVRITKPHLNLREEINKALTLEGIANQPITVQNLVSKGNLMVGKTNPGNNVVGGQISSDGSGNFTVSGDTVSRLNRLSSEGEILRFQKDTTSVGSIGVIATNNLYITAPGDDIGLGIGDDNLYPTNGTGNSTDGALDLGDETARFNIIYGTTKLDIHNEGNDTTASILLSANNNTGTPGQRFNSTIRYNGAAGYYQIMHYGSGEATGTERFRIDATGDSYTNDGTISSISDIRVKKDIEDLQDGLDIVKQLRPVTFKYNGLSSMAADDDRINYGFIADEVQAVAPQYVKEDTQEINGEKVDDFKSLSTGRMIPMLFKAVQELSAQVEALQAEINALKGE